MQEKRRPSLGVKHKLFEIANSQEGFFTSKQAIEAGVNKRNFFYHVNAGNWIKEGHGIYRLANYPQSAQAQYIPIWLWTRNKQGIPEGAFSHETALSIWGLSDLMPSKIHISVAKNFRRSSHPPSEVILHKEQNLYVTKSGVVDVVNALQALTQVYEAETQSRDIVAQGFNQAVARGLIHHLDFDRVPMKEGTRAFFDGLRMRSAS